MTTKTYHGSCHCGRVTFEADIDFAAGTGKCNCSICWKIRNWSVIVKPEAFRSLTGRDELGTYTFASGSNTHAFCKHCGVHAYGWGHVPEIGGDYFGVAVSCLDDLDPADLVAAPIKHMDGRADRWWLPPAEVRHL